MCLRIVCCVRCGSGVSARLQAAQVCTLLHGVRGQGRLQRGCVAACPVTAVALAGFTFVAPWPVGLRVRAVWRCSHSLAVHTCVSRGGCGRAAGVRELPERLLTEVTSLGLAPEWIRVCWAR